jgi:cyclophilin family peptidyl-prolyl cis-trans isomerase
MRVTSNTRNFLSCSITFLILLTGIFALSCKSESTPSKSASTPSGNFAVIETDFGNIKIKFASDVAPNHVEHIIKLTREGFYDGLGFHRAVPGMLIQGGDPQTRSGDPSLWGMGMPGQETVPAEFSDRPFVRGTVGMARRGPDINSATSQFFIALRDKPDWNGQYTVVGEVVEGIEVVDRISRLPTSDPNGKLAEKLVMKRVSIEN